jgi:hypothetical protein
MKFRYIIFVGCSLFLAACNDFLELKPKSQGIAVNNANVDAPLYASASEVEAALSGAYADFRNEYFELDYFVNGDAQSDDAYAGGDNPFIAPSERLIW